MYKTVLVVLFFLRPYYFLVLVVVESSVRLAQGLPKIHINDGITSVSAGILMTVCSKVNCRSTFSSVRSKIMSSYKGVLKKPSQRLLNHAVVQLLASVTGQLELKEIHSQFLKVLVNLR